MYSKMGYHTCIRDEWLSWFIGFVEGDGAILSYKERPRFVITQKESRILYEIQNTLGFGKVYAYSSKNTVFHRYIVTDIKSILLLTLLFNGNLLIPHRIKQLTKWISDVNNRLITSTSSITNVTDPIIQIMAIQPVSLNNAWISGFTDAEGCFNVSIIKRDARITGYRVQIRFVLDQKNAFDVLQEIRDQFQYGKVIERSVSRKGSMYRYYCDSFAGLKPIIDYFVDYPLKTKKSVSFENWLRIYNMVINKEHLSDKGLTTIRETKRIININNSLSTKTGSANP